jgi:hypothetical protein
MFLEGARIINLHNIDRALKENKRRIACLLLARVNRYKKVWMLYVRKASSISYFFFLFLNRIRLGLHAAMHEELKSIYQTEALHA